MTPSNLKFALKLTGMEVRKFDEEFNHIQTVYLAESSCLIPDLVFYPSILLHPPTTIW